MFNPVILLSDNYTSFSSAWPHDLTGNVYPSFLMEGSDTQKLNEAYQFCSTNNPNHFSISIAVSGPVEASYIKDIISFFFIPSYYAINGQRICNLISTRIELLQQVKQQILDFSSSQGIENLAINCLTAYDATAGTGNAAAKPEHLLFTSTKDLLIYYKITILAADDYHKIFFLYDPHPDIIILSAAILEANDTIRNENPAVYRLKTGIQAITTENDLLKKKYLSVINELNNYKLHLEMMRSTHQAKELQDYYDGEYEILPRWYKRVGHVLKVMMGKRSFHSLFSDNAKKHSN